MKSLFKTILTESDFSSCYIPVRNGYLAITNTGSSQPPSWEGKQGGCGRPADICVMDTELCGCLDVTPVQRDPVTAHMALPAGT